MFDPRSDKTTGYHLFLEPAGALFSELSSLITSLSVTHGGPSFKPHVTLLAGMPEEDEDGVLTRTKALADSLSPFTLTLGELESEDAYFRALYIQIQEQEAMRDYHAQASQICSMDPNSAYLPHLSLLYGNYSDELKEKVRSEITLPQTASFLVDRIHLYRTEGRASNWYKVQEFLFHT